MSDPLTYPVADHEMVRQFTHWLAAPDSTERVLGLRAALGGMSEPTRAYISNMLAIVRGDATPVVPSGETQ